MKTYELKDKDKSLSLAEAQRSQRKMRYAGDQNSEADEFCPHFMPFGQK
jgi:hypothetical protein